MTVRVPYVNIAAQHAPLKEKILGRIGTVLDHGKFILGDEVEEFENRFAELCNVRYAIGVNSGTDALIMVLKALGIGPGDEVITVPNSFISTVGSVCSVGARPVFVDVGQDYNINVECIEQAITPKTRAILPVHLTGRPAAIDRILDVTRQHDLHLIEDCAQAVCAEYHGRGVGSLGNAGCFSLHPLKTLGAGGDAGVITTNSRKLNEILRRARNLGLRSRDECQFWGGNSRLDTMQAAILLAKFDHLDEWTKRRIEIARFYQAKLVDLKTIHCPQDRPTEKAVYHTFVIQSKYRDELRTYLLDNGIGCGIHYPVPIHLQEAARHLGYATGSFPVAERQAKRILSLPIYPELAQDQLNYVVDCLHEFERKMRSK